MRLKKIIKRFVFEEDNRSKITLGADVRLNPDLYRLQLKADSDDEYPITADLYAKTWVTNPTSAKQWLNFEVFAYHPKDDLGQPLTSLGFRLGNGTNEYWWNGASWEINTSDWNTEAEVANNITDFPATSKSIQVIINLVTTDKAVTPLVEEIRILYASDIEFQEDLIVRSFIPLVRVEVQPIADYLIEMIATSNTIDLEDDYPLETPYNITGIDSVFNHTDDPDHNTDLYQSYDTGTKIITLDAAVDSGKMVWIRFYYEPEIAITTSQEYSEHDKVPLISLSDIRLINKRQIGAATAVINRDAGTGTKVPGPRQTDIEITLHGITASSKDQQRLADELRRFFANNPMMLSIGLDEEYRLWLTSEYAIRTVPGQSELHTGLLRFRIVGALYYQEQSEDVYAVERLQLIGDMDVTIE